MEISTDSWNSLTLPFKAMGKLYEFRNAEMDAYIGSGKGNGKSPELETGDKGLIPSQPLTKCESLGKLCSLSGTPLPTLVK